MKFHYYLWRMVSSRLSGSGGDPRVGLERARESQAGYRRGWEQEGITSRFVAWRRRQSLRRGNKVGYCDWGILVPNIKGTY